MGTLGWLLQWPIRALVLLVVAALPLGVELASFGTALWAAVASGRPVVVMFSPTYLLHVNKREYS